MPAIDSFVGAGLNDSPWKECEAELARVREEVERLRAYGAQMRAEAGTWRRAVHAVLRVCGTAENESVARYNAAIDAARKP